MSNDTDRRLEHLELVVRNLVEARGAQMVAFGALIRALRGKGLLTEEEWQRTCTAALSELPADLQRGIPGNTLRELANLLSVKTRH